MVEIRRGDLINPGTIGAAIGTTVAGPIGGLAGKILADALASAVVQAGQRPTNTMDQATAIDVAPDVVEIALKDPRVQDLVKHVDNVTNNEPASKSKVYQGVAIAGAGTVGTLVMTILAVGEVFDYDLTSKTAAITIICTSLVTAAGIGRAWYGRWKASKKPLIGG